MIEFISPDQRTKAEKAFQTLITEGSINAFELDYLNKDGQHHHTLASGIIIDDVYEQTQTVVLRALDVTYQKRLRQQLQDAKRLSDIRETSIMISQINPTNLGETKKQILQIISQKESHGYGIWKSLNEEYSKTISIASVYQHLSELVKLNLLLKKKDKSIVGKRRRRYYNLTEKGKKELQIKT
jgi:DNA-binding MarR family transcriptional regulator